MKKDRTELPRFHVGQVVRVTTTIMSSRSLQVGKIVSVQTSSRAQTLDKYIVQFSDNSLATFWDIQLEPILRAPRPSASATNR